MGLVFSAPYGRPGNLNVTVISYQGLTSELVTQMAKINAFHEPCHRKTAPREKRFGIGMKKI
jgi:hypothetical protein